MGIDPGSRVTGYGLILTEGAARIDYRAAGQIAPPAKASLARRLEIVYNGLIELMALHKPDEVAVEDVFFFRNARSALALGHVRGVALLAAAKSGLPVFTYNNQTIKKSVVGYGKATKDQIGHMMRAMLKIQTPLGPDAADALACALCHINCRSTLARIEAELK